MPCLWIGIFSGFLSLMFTDVKYGMGEHKHKRDVELLNIRLRKAIGLLLWNLLRRILNRPANPPRHCLEIN